MAINLFIQVRIQATFYLTKFCRGNKNINRKIISTLSLRSSDNFDYDELIIISNKKIVETSKNSKGQVNSYRTEINVEFKIVNNNEIMNKKFSKDFSYNNLDNKFDLTSYQDDLKIIL